jgi:shikimate kinase
MIISLIGYRGTGKSTLAQGLATALHWNMIDTDQALQDKLGMTIHDMFTQHGEQFFRDHEAELIASLLKSDENLILSTGGGAILREETRQKLSHQSQVIWLHATAEVIHERLANDSQTLLNRPALTNLPPLAEISHLLEVRDPLYTETAHIIIDTNHQSADEILQDALLQLFPKTL